MSRFTNENLVRQQNQVSARSARATTRNTKRIQEIENKINELKERLTTLNDELILLNDTVPIAHAKYNSASIRLQRSFLRITLETDRLRQEQLRGNAGIDYADLQADYANFRGADTEDLEGESSRYERSIRIENDISTAIRPLLIPLIDERDRAKQELNETKHNYDKLFKRQSNIIQEIPTLQHKIEVLNTQYLILIQTQAGKKKHNTYKKYKHRRSWSLKYKRSINCKRARGFSQKQHCKSRKSKQ